MRLLLWLAALCALPVPFFLLEPELSPVLRLAFLSGLLSVVLASDADSTLGIMTAMGWVQTLGYLALLWLAAHGLARALEWLFAPGPRGVLVVVLVIGLFAVSFAEIYDTPLSSTRPRSNLTQIFE